MYLGRNEFFIPRLKATIENNKGYVFVALGYLQSNEGR